jgi:hypothetical protein
MRSSQGKQIVAGVVGTFGLALSARYTFGVALVASLGLAVASVTVRRRGRSLTRVSSWVGAVVAVEVALIGIVAFGATRLPAGSFQQIKHTMDSSQANPPPPPAWLERIAPGATARSNARASASTGQLGGAFGAWALVVGAVFITGMIATFVGTVGWLATLPLAYAITGRWIGSNLEHG